MSCLIRNPPLSGIVSPVPPLQAVEPMRSQSSAEDRSVPSRQEAASFGSGDCRRLAEAVFKTVPLTEDCGIKQLMVAVGEFDAVYIEFEAFSDGRIPLADAGQADWLAG